MITKKKKKVYKKVHDSTIHNSHQLEIEHPFATEGLGRRGRGINETRLVAR